MSSDNESKPLIAVGACGKDDLDALADHPAVAYLTLSESEKEEVAAPSTTDTEDRHA